MVRSLRRGFTLVELLVVITVIAILAGLLFPVFGTVQESARQSACQNKLSQLGLAMQVAKGQLTSSLYYNMTGTRQDDMGNDVQIQLKNQTARQAGLENLSSLQPGQPGQGENGAPYSFLVSLLPFIERQADFDSIDHEVGPFEQGTLETEVQRSGNFGVAATVIQAFRCPSFNITEETLDTDNYTNHPDTVNAPALTQYKALGATTVDVLADPGLCLSSNGGGGAIHPWGRPSISKLQAASSTALLCETREERLAAWIDGTFASIPGVINDESDQSGQQLGITGLNVGPMSAEDETRFLDTTRAFNNGQIGNNMEMEWGPSSLHGGIVHHLLGGRSVQPITDNVDVLAYRALISRDGRDNRNITDLFNSDE